MQRRYFVLAAMAVTLGPHAPANAETSCDLAQAAQDKVVTVRGTVKSIGVDRGDGSYWVIVELRDRCGALEVQVSTKQSPRCRAGATVSVTGPLTSPTTHLIEARRIVCLK